jgi:hypothetical protein
VKSTHVEVNPETLWAKKLRYWPSAVLAELALRIKEELSERSSRQKEKRAKRSRKAG